MQRDSHMIKTIKLARLMADRAKIRGSMTHGFLAASLARPFMFHRECKAQTGKFDALYTYALMSPHHDASVESFGQTLDCDQTCLPSRKIEKSFKAHSS
jgi:hypothetical protein